MAKPKSDKRKSSAELEADIKELQKAIDEKRKLAQAARKREDDLAKRAREIEEAQFNREFVEAARDIYLSECPHDGRTIYQHIRDIIRPAVPPEPVQAEGDDGDDSLPEPVQVPGDAGRHTDPMEGSLLRPFGTHTT